MGHASLETTMRYLTVVDEEKMAAVRVAFGSRTKKLGDRLGETENEKPKSVNFPVVIWSPQRDSN